MVGAQYAFIAIVIGVAAYFIRTRSRARTKAYKKILLITFLVLSIVAILWPSSLTFVANLLGIGRGADLLLYGVALTVLFQLINTYVKDREEQATIHKLARRVAILEANIDKNIKTK